MLFIVLAIVIAIFFTWELVDGFYDLIDYLMGFLIFVIISILLGAFGLGIAVLIGTLPHKHLEQVDRFSIVAINDNVGPHGQFFLGSGQVNNELKYFYYRKDGDAYKADQADSSSLIFQDEQNNPYVIEKEDTFDHGFWYLIAMPVHIQTEFHIPKNSILNNYQLDLK